MSNKKLHLVFWLVLAMLVGVVWSFTSAVTFTLDFWGDYRKPETWGAIRLNMVPIHFADNWNDFHWFIYFSDGIVEATWGVNQRYYVKVAGSSDSFECQKKVKGFYYNAERWERLWPLDGGYGGIIANGWLYTRCRKAGYSEKLAACERMGEREREICEDNVEKEYVDTNGYYWIVTHEVSGQKFALVAWTSYWVKPWDNWVTLWNQLKPTFVRIGNKYPVWFIYDVSWGAWFVGCEIRDVAGGSNNAQTVLDRFNSAHDVGSKRVIENWHDLFTLQGNSIKTDYLPVDCNDEWSAMNSLVKVVVDGLVWINKTNTWNMGIQWNQGNAKMQYFSSVSVNNMQLINYARQRAEVLCRWKWKAARPAASDGIVCISWNPWMDPIEAKTDETLIVKWWVNVKIKDMSGFEGSDYYDIFVDGGNLLIEPDADNLTVFKKNWFKSSNSLSDFRSAVNSAKTAGIDYSGEDVAAWRFIRGNFIVNGNIKPGWSLTGLENVYFVYGKMTSKDTVDELEEVFVWRCNVGSGSDSQGTPCPWSWKDVDGTIWNNPYQNASLVIIDQNYPSPLYQ